MKKILLLGVSIFTLLNTFAQSDSTIIKMLPKEGQGYLVLNLMVGNQMVDNWKVTIKEKIVDTTNNTVTYNPIINESLYGINYLAIDDTIYNNDKYVLDVMAYDKDRNSIGQTGNVVFANGPQYEIIKTWKCNGLYYAYEIQQHYKSSTGASIFQLSTTGTGYSNDPYYYQYSGNESDADAWKLYHHVNYIGYNNIYNYAKAIHIINSPATYYDATGSPITNNVYGVAKNLGPWLGAPPMLENSDGTAKIFYNSNFDNYTLNNIIGFYNDYLST